MAYTDSSFAYQAGQADFGQGFGLILSASAAGSVTANFPNCFVAAGQLRGSNYDYPIETAAGEVTSVVLSCF